MTTAHVRIFYPADPLGVVPGGVDTFIRGILKWAPPTLDFSLVGMTTDAAARPPGRWSRCRLGERGFGFFPVVRVADAGTRTRVPLSLRFTGGAWRHRRALADGFDVFDFHRPEPSLLYGADTRPKNAFWHQDPKTIDGAGSDNLWRRLPAAYARLEARAAARLASAWCVRESGVATLRERYPALGERVQFLPTWVDADVFGPADAATRRRLRHELAARHGVAAGAGWVVSVGRLDTQKNPALLIEAFAKLVRRGRDAALLMVGDGVLRRDLQRQARAAGVAERVHFLGLQPQAEIARLLQAADLFALSSAYEGMPMALLEALGCGTPAVVTDVGEVRRVVRSGVNGIVVEGGDAQAFAQGLVLGLDASARWRDAAVAAVEPFQPARVLQPVYANYLRLAQAPAALRALAERQDRDARDTRRREQVVGAPVDVMRGSAVVGQIVRWARQRESRAVCFCNVHSAVLAARSVGHAQALRAADLVVPDGAPVAWTLRRRHHPGQDRVDGPGTMWRVLAAVREHGVRVGLYGATPATLAALQEAMGRRFPGLQVSYAHAPPFRDATPEEDERDCRDIDAAGVGLLLVGLGCPKQERWIAQHRGRIPAVMLGVGAAFDFHAGTVARAPAWMRGHGLEWLHRLGSEPRRLGWRYLSSNSAFVAATLRGTVRPGAPAAAAGAPWAPTDTGVSGAGAATATSAVAVASLGWPLSPTPPSSNTPIPAAPSAVSAVSAASAATDAALNRARLAARGDAPPPGADGAAPVAIRRPPPTDRRPATAIADAAVPTALPSTSSRACAAAPASAPPPAPASPVASATPARASPAARWAAPAAPGRDADRSPRPFERSRLDPPDAMAGRLARQRAIAELVARLDADLPGERARVVGFVASKHGEGTSTLARAYAQANADSMARRVLLLRTGSAAGDHVDVAELLREAALRRPATADAARARGRVAEAALGLAPARDGAASVSWGEVVQPALWRALRESFDLVVVDIESAEHGDVALRVAPLCDGVVVVLEAARTRAPVVGQLLSNLHAVHARVLGTVLNKRRFDLPARLYRWL